MDTINRDGEATNFCALLLVRGWERGAKNRPIDADSR
jgi:hypothetical protein